MSGIWVQVAQLFLSLSLLIILHELGHFIPAKLFKTRVEKFYLFFDPYFSLFKIKKGDTEYGIGWLPFGGYVKISGMIDESMDKEQLAKDPEPWEFRSKPAWQRLIIMLGGVTVNLVLAVLIYGMVLFVWGESKLPVSSMKNGIQVDSIGQVMGFRSGDMLLRYDETPIEDFFTFHKKILQDSPERIYLLRDGKEVSIDIDKRFLKTMVKNGKTRHLSPRVEFFVEAFAAPEGEEMSAAEKIGIQKGDHLIGMNDIKTPFFDQFKEQTVLNTGKEVSINVLRDGKELVLSGQIPENGLLGIFPTPTYLNDQVVTEYSFFQAFPAGILKAFDILDFYVAQMGLIFDFETEAYKQVGGFAAMSQTFPPVWEWEAFWTITAFFSIVLAFMNVLPIPALDGGHALFLFYEIIVGRKPADKFLEYAQVVGMVLVLGLLLFANGNDIFGAIFGK